MPATATRSRENSAETRDSFYFGPSVPAHDYSPDFVASPRIPQAATSQVYGFEGDQDEAKRDEESVEWQQVAPLVDRFTQVNPAERKRRRGLHRRHRNFVMSSVFWVGLLFGVELVGLVFLYSTDLRAIRYEKSLQSQLDKTSLDIALAQNQLAVSSSPAKLDVWAQQLGYHKAKLDGNEMDDVTSSAPMPTPSVATP